MYTFLRFVGIQTWLRFGIRDRVIRRFCNPDEANPLEFVCKFFGMQFKGNLNNYIDWNIYFYGSYELENLIFCKSIIKNKKKPVCIDIGANVGVYSLFLSQIAETVHSFEPNPKVRKNLEENLMLNSISNVVVHEVGLGANNEKLPYYAPAGSNQGTGSFVKGYSKNNEAVGTYLEIVNGDQYFDRLNLSQIDFIKIDVEGFEKNVLTGLKNNINKYRPIIFLEYSEATKQSFDNFSELILMFPQGYKVKRIQNCKPKFLIFNSINTTLEDFVFEKSGGEILIFPVESEQFVFKMIDTRI